MRTAMRILPLLTLLAALSFGVAAWADHKRKNQEPIPFAGIDFFFELNDTDNDLGVQLNLGGEPWKRLRVFDPCGDRIMDVSTASDLKKHGLSDLFFESAEPSFDEISREEILARFPAGTYTFVGRTIDGQKLEGTAELTHDLPDGPVICAPEEGEEVDADDDLEVHWSEVTTPSGIEIESYEVIVTNDEDSRFVFDVRLPSTARCVTVPAGFLEPGTEYELEVLAREKSGNQTISIVFFETGED